MFFMMLFDVGWNSVCRISFWFLFENSFLFLSSERYVLIMMICFVVLVVR